MSYMEIKVCGKVIPLSEFLMTGKCIHCSSIDSPTGLIQLRLEYRPSANQIQARCVQCGKWISHVKHTEDFSPYQTKEEV